MSTSSKIFQTM